MESFKSLFRKKPKHYDELFSNSYAANRSSIGQLSFRGVQQHPQQHNHQQQQQQPLPLNPYHVVTAPKTKKATRSLPGSRIGGGYSARQHRIHHANNGNNNSIMYENLADNSLMMSARMYGQQQQKARRPRRIDEEEQLEELEEGAVVLGRLRRPRPPPAFHQNSVGQYSSEYGSADPSPTNPFSRTANNNNRTADRSFEESSDCDSETEESIAEYYKSLYEKDLRKLERKYRKAEHTAEKYHQRYLDLQDANKALHTANKELKSQNYKLEQQIKDLRIDNNALRSRVEELEKQQQQNAAVPNIGDHMFSGGAPEALCSFSELNPSESLPPPPYSAHQRYPNFVAHDESDEVKIFRSEDALEVENARRSASNSILGSAAYNPIESLSPPGHPHEFHEHTIKADDEEENAYLLVSAKQQAESSENRPIDNAENVGHHHNKNQTVHFNYNADDGEEEEDQPHYENRRRRSPPIMDLRLYVPDSYSEAPTLPLRRSFSEPALNEQAQQHAALENVADRYAGEEQANEEEEEVTARRSQLPPPPSASRKSSDRARLRRFQTRYMKPDYSSSYSSEDDTLALRSRQLKTRGNLVHYRPPRRSVLNKGTNVYRRFGPKEKGVVAEFDFLKEHSTDLSGLTSS